MEKRVEFIDIAKGIGIILVCIGHAITNAPKSAEISYPYWLEFISQFHMPLFFALSGFVYSDKYSNQPVKSSLKKFKSYYIPFVVYNLIFVALHNVMYGMHIFEDLYSAKDFVKQTLLVLTLHVMPICGAMWFLRSLLTIVILFIWIRWFSNKVGKEKDLLVTTIIVVAFMLFGISTKCPDTFYLAGDFYYLPYFYLGYLCKRLDWNSGLSKYKYLFFGLGLTVNLIAAYFTRVAFLKRGNYQYDWLCYILGVFGICMIVSLAQFKGIGASKLLKWLGNYSLDIMSLHFVTFKIVSAAIILILGLEWSHMSDKPVVFGVEGFWWILYVLVGLFASAGLRVGYNFIKGKIIR